MQKADRTWELLCHLAALLQLVPFMRLGNLVGPLVIWLLKRHASPTVDQHGRAALNFQLSMTLYFAVIWIVALILGKLPGPLAHAGLAPTILMRIWEIVNLWFIIQAALKTGRGEAFKYPLSIRFLPAKA